MAQLPVDPTRPLTPLTPLDTDPDTPRFDTHQMSHSSPCSPHGSGHPLLTPLQPFPLPRLPLCPPLNTSTYEFVEDYYYIVSHEPLNMNGRNLLSLPDNVCALWTQIGHLQQVIEGRDHRIHSIELQFNNVLQTLASQQLSHQSLQDTVHCGHQDVDEEVMALQSQLDVLREQPPITAPMLVIKLSPGNPVPSVTSTQAPITSNTPKPNLKPLNRKPGIELSATPSLNYLESFSGAPLLKQVIFALSLMTHAKSQSWMNTCQDWLANNPTCLPPTIMMLLDNFVREFRDYNAAISTQH